MRKILSMLLLTSVLMLTLSMPVKAALNSMQRIQPTLTMNGTTATCRLMVYAANTSYPIEATVTLKCGNTVIEEWTDLTATGYLNFSDTATVTHGNTYTMVTTLKINGVSQNVADISKTCN